LILIDLFICISAFFFHAKVSEIIFLHSVTFIYEGWNFNSGNYLFTTDTK